MFILFLLITGCTRPVSQNSQLVLNLNGPEGLTATNFRTQLEGTTAFGALPVTSAQKIDCIAVLVLAAPGAVESCTLADETEIQFTHSAGFVAKNQALTLELPPGPSRQIQVLGVRSLNGTCPDLSVADRIHISQPRVIASITKDLTPGENLVSVTADVAGGAVRGCQSEKFFHKSAACNLVSEYDPASIHSDQVIVHLADSADITAFDEELGHLGMSLTLSWNAVYSHHFMLPAGLTPAGAAVELCSSPMVQFVEPVDVNFVARVYESVVDWSASVNTESVVAVLATGLEMGHSVFTAYTNSYWTNPFGETGGDEDMNGIAGDINGYNFVDDNPDLSDGDGLGTQLAGIVLNQDVDILSGPGSTSISVLPVKTIDDFGATDATRMASGIQYATDMNADVIVLASGDVTGSEIVRRSLIYANNRGVLIVAPSGNSATNNDLLPLFPSSYGVPNILSVGAHTGTFTKAAFSNYGAASVDIAGSGVTVFTTTIGDIFTSVSGTSMAAASVAGAAAVAKTGADHVSGYQLKKAVFDTAAPSANWTGLSTTGGYLDFTELLNEISAVYLFESYEQPTE